MSNKTNMNLLVEIARGWKCNPLNIGRHFLFFNNLNNLLNLNIGLTKNLPAYKRNLV